jgi:hypothetical protein
MQRGRFSQFDYAVALRQLGGNISFNRFQLMYRRYYKMSALRDTVFAGNFTFGLANLFNLKIVMATGASMRLITRCQLANDSFGRFNDAAWVQL